MNAQVKNFAVAKVLVDGAYELVSAKRYPTVEAATKAMHKLADYAGHTVVDVTKLPGAPSDQSVLSLQNGALHDAQEALTKSLIADIDLESKIKSTISAKVVWQAVRNAFNTQGDVWLLAKSQPGKPHELVDLSRENMDAILFSVFEFLEPDSKGGYLIRKDFIPAVTAVDKEARAKEESEAFKIAQGYQKQIESALRRERPIIARILADKASILERVQYDAKAAELSVRFDTIWDIATVKTQANNKTLLNTFIRLGGRSKIMEFTASFRDARDWASAWLASLKPADSGTTSGNNTPPVDYGTETKTLQGMAHFAEKQAPGSVWESASTASKQSYIHAFVSCGIALGCFDAKTLTVDMDRLTAVLEIERLRLRDVKVAPEGDKATRLKRLRDELMQHRPESEAFSKLMDKIAFEDESLLEADVTKLEADCAKYWLGRDFADDYCNATTIEERAAILEEVALHTDLMMDADAFILAYQLKDVELKKVA